MLIGFQKGNYQYGGDTIGSSKEAATFDICVGYCDTTAGCVDVIYDSAKYCYLKSSKTNGYASPNWWTAVKRTTAVAAATTTTSSATVASTVATVPTGPNCVDGSSNGTIYNSGTALYDIVCNYQYNGATLGGSKYAATFATCVGFCDTTAGCVDVVYSSAKYCWLKSTKLSGYSSPNWWVAVKRPANLVADGGFESGNLNKWAQTAVTSSGGVVASLDTSTDVGGGNYALLLASSYYNTWNSCSLTIGQTLTTTKGVTYKISIDQKGSGGGSNSWSIVVGTTTIASGSYGGNEQWSTITGTFTAAGNDVLSISGGSLTWGIASWWYDNIVVIPAQY